MFAIASDPIRIEMGLRLRKRTTAPQPQAHLIFVCHSERSEEPQRRSNPPRSSDLIDDLSSRRRALTFL